MTTRSNYVSESLQIPTEGVTSDSDLSARKAALKRA